MLGVDADRAEAYAAQMIEQGRLSGYIDQIDGLIHLAMRRATVKAQRRVVLALAPES